ncbi:MAG: LamG domain-containing protein [Kofleriaceae bacterium]
MRFVWLLGPCIAACAFNPAGLPGVDGDAASDGAGGDDGGGRADAGADAPGDAASPDAPPVDAGGDPFCAVDSPLACFRMNQATGGPIDGASPPLGTLRGDGATYAPGCHGRALALGAGVYVRTAEPTPPLRELSVSAWVKLDAPPAPGDTGVHYWFDGEEEWGLSYVADPAAGTIEIRCTMLRNVTENAATARATVPSLTTWTHLACSYDRGKVRLFVAGTKYEVNPSDADLIDVDHNGIQLGRDGVDQATGYVDGLIDDVRLWDHRVADAVLTADAAIPCD